MANHTIVSPPSNANQENVAPSVDPLVNVRSTAREAYSVAEAVDVISVVVRQNDKQSKHSPRFYLDAIKQKMIDDVRVPVQRSQLNRLLGVTKG